MFGKPLVWLKYLNSAVAVAPHYPNGSVECTTVVASGQDVMGALHAHHVHSRNFTAGSYA